jgi:low affinity Fe/Cu permease
MATEAQIRANQQNSQHSTGPTTESGKAASCKNNFKYGLTGSSFTVLDFEDQDEFDQLLSGLRFEHQPSTMTESILVEQMAQSYWLRKRALYLQDQCATDEELNLEQQEKRLALFIRYQTTHDRAFHRALNDLLKLRAETRRSEIGFESQQHKKAQESRREAGEKRKQELHELAVLLAEAKVSHQQVLTNNLELDRTRAEIAQNRDSEARKAA